MDISKRNIGFCEMVLKVLFLGINFERSSWRYSCRN